MGRFALIAMFLVAATVGFARSEATEAVTIELDAGQHDRSGVPVFFTLPAELDRATALELVRSDTNEPVPVQIEAGPSPRAVWMLAAPLPAGRTRRYRLRSTESGPQPDAGVAVKDDGRRWLVSLGGKPVLAYNHAVVPCPDREQPWFDRSGFIHPLYSPAGDVLTDGMPPDHYHQHGVMFPWTNTTFEGRDVDFWNSKKLQGKVEHVEVALAAGGPVFASLDVELAHVDLTAPAGPKNALDETWRIRVYRRSNAFLFDLESVQRCATESPLSINRFHYGAMALHGARAWFEEEAFDYLTSEGKTRTDGNHTRPHWVDMHGRRNGRTAGVTVFCWPDNFRSPQPVRLHPTKPYFCWAPLVLGPFTIEPDVPYRSRYRYFVHNGVPDPGQAESIFNSLADPPLVRMVAE